MNNQAGILIFTDQSQVQKSRETGELSEYLSRQRVIRSEDLTNDISVIFQNGSAKRSNFFMDFRYRDYASMTRGINYQMPVYGVKGLTPKITRDARYVELLMCEEKDLTGARFNDLIFGTTYLTGEETVTLNDRELVAAMDDGRAAVGCGVGANWKNTICHLVEKIWEAMENDPRTRFVIRMKRAESRSMAILQQIYSLLPKRLRLQTGFETNVGRADLEQIERSGIPIYILTMDRSEVLEKEQFSFPVVVFNLENEDSYSYDASRLSLIGKLADTMDARRLSELDGAETAFLAAREETASSFKYYGDILRGLVAGGNFWWEKESFDSVESLKKAYDSQADLMAQEGYRKEAFAALYTRIYPNSDLAGQTVNILKDSAYPNRDGLLNFLTGDLGQKKQLDAVWGLKIALNQEKENALKAQRKEHDAALQHVQAQFAEAQTSCRRLQDANDELKRDKMSLEQDNEKLRGLNAGNQFVQTTSGEKEKLTHKIRELETAKAGSDRTKIILGIVAGIFGAAAILFSVLWLTKTPAEKDSEFVAVENTDEQASSDLAPTEAVEAQPAAVAESGTEVQESEGGQLDKTDEKVMPEKAEKLSEEQNEGSKVGENVSVDRLEELTGSGESNENGTAAPSEEVTENDEGDMEGVAAWIAENDVATTESEVAGKSENQTSASMTGESEGITDNDAATEILGDTDVSTAKWSALTVSEAISAAQGEEPERGFADAFFSDNEWIGVAQTVYLHVKFADDEQGTNISEDATKPYIGFYVSTMEHDNLNVELDDGSMVYRWIKTDELSDSEGLLAEWYNEPEQKYYLHLAYADSDNDIENFSTTESEGRACVGWAVDRNPEDPESVYAYTWLPRNSEAVTVASNARDTFQYNE